MPPNRSGHQNSKSKPQLRTVECYLVSNNLLVYSLNTRHMLNQNVIIPYPTFHIGSSTVISYSILHGLPMSNNLL